MNFLCNINQSFADLLINYLNLIIRKKQLFGGLLQKRCSWKFCKIFKNTLFQGIPLVAASERVNADEIAHLCSVAVGKENSSGEA